MFSTEIDSSHSAWFVRLWIAIIIFVVPYPIMAQQHMYLKISTGSWATSQSGCIAGGLANLYISVRLPNGQSRPIEYRSPSCDWPQGLTIRVATTDSISHPEWLPEMQIHRCIPMDEAFADSFWRTDGIPVMDIYKTEHYQFLYNVPSNAIGQAILFTATFDHPEFGRLETNKPAMMHITSIQSEEDLHLVWDSQLIGLMMCRELEQVIILADSFISQGYSGLEGLASAESAAKDLKRYSVALRYLDLNMSANGAMGVWKGNEVKPGTSREETRRIRAERNQTTYQRVRNEYLQKIAEQQQDQNEER